MDIIDVKKIRNIIFNNTIWKFIAVGGCSTGIDFVVYMLLSLELRVTISKGISMIVASLFSYIANKKFTFRHKEKTNTAYLIKFYIVFALNFVTNLTVHHIIFEMYGQKVVAFVLATVCGMTVNYLGQRFFVFKK